MYKSFYKFLLVCLFVSCGSAALAQADSIEVGLPREQVVTEQLKKTIATWAGAWQSQLPDLYIAHYSLDYIAPGFGNRQDWLADRRVKLIEPEFIKIRLVDFELVSLEGNSVTTRFTMIYESPDYADETYKELILTERNGLWLIEQENNLEVEVL